MAENIGTNWKLGCRERDSSAEFDAGLAYGISDFGFPGYI